MDKLLFKRILIGALTALALVYAAYLLISANFNVYPTEVANQTTITDKVYANAFIIRDETYINNNSSEVLSYSVNDGDEVSVDGTIAKLYSSEADAAAQTKADDLQDKLTSLQELQKTSASSGIGIDTINNSINNNVTKYLEDINNSDITKVSEDVDSIVYSINQRQAFTGKISSFSAEIADLQSQIDTLKNSSGQSTGTLKTPKAGYFSSYCDGYENVFKYSDIDKLTLNDLNSVSKSTVSDNVAGKVISSLNWYVACEISASEAESLSRWDSNVTVLFSNASAEFVPASIYKIEQDSSKDKALLILQCDYMDTNLAEARQEPIEIGIGTYTGLRVSKNAIHDDYVSNVTYDDNNKKNVEQKKVQGVYVLYGSEVQFKQIDILYSGNDYVLCNPSPDSDVLFNGETISLYDQVILEGDDLYAGKVIE